MIDNELGSLFKERVLFFQERLKKPSPWYPYPALISVGLIMVLSGQLLPGLNPRLGSRANIIQLDAPPEMEGSIWLGIYPRKGGITLITSEKNIFKWATSGISPQTKKRLVNYLKSRVSRENISAALTLSTSLPKVRAVLAVDQTLKYQNIVPVLHALADARISKYSFEARLVKN
tara:strand:+ start:187 stop:711 length:525 start_codon:yes stop_codon:yes gene_type:complete